MNSTVITTTTRLDIKLPSGLPQLLEVLARECIRKQPENIYTFLAGLTTELLEKRDNDEKVEYKTEKKATGEKVVESQAAAAVKIQASYRGYKTRKSLKEVKAEKRKDEEIAAELGSPLGTIRESVEEEAAVKIQSGVRGFLTRRRLLAQKSSDATNNNSKSVEDIPSYDESMNTIPGRSDEVILETEAGETDEIDHEMAVERILKQYGHVQQAPISAESSDDVQDIAIDDKIMDVAEAKLSTMPTTENYAASQVSVDTTDFFADESSQDEEVRISEAEFKAQTAILSERANHSLPEKSIDICSTSEPALVESDDSNPTNPNEVLQNELNDESEFAITSNPASETDVVNVIDLRPQQSDISNSSVSDEQQPEEPEAADKRQVSFDIFARVNNESPPVPPSAEEIISSTAESSDSDEKEDITTNSVQLIDGVLAEAQSVVESLKDNKKEPANAFFDHLAVVSKDDTDSESDASRNNIIQVEIHKEVSNSDPSDDLEGEEPKPFADVDVVAIIPKEDILEPVALRGRSADDSEKPVVVRRSKRNTTSDVQNKYRSGFVEVEPEPVKSSKSKNENMSHIEESDIEAEIETEMMNNAATRIQAGFRGYKARSTLNKAKASATCIQANFRGYKARRKIEKEKKAVVTIQATVRGFLARRRLTKAKLANQSKRRKSSLGLKQRRRSSTLTAAAIRIQSAYRGYTVRKNCKESRQSASPADLRIEDVAISQNEMIEG